MCVSRYYFWMVGQNAFYTTVSKLVVVPRSANDFFLSAETFASRATSSNNFNSPIAIAAVERERRRKRERTKGPVSK